MEMMITIIILLFQDIVNKSEQALKEWRSYQQSSDMDCSCSLQVLAENLISLTENFKVKLEERMKKYKKQNAFLEVLQKVKMRVLNFKLYFVSIFLTADISSRLKHGTKNPNSSGHQD